MTKSADFDKCKYSHSNRFRFEAHRSFLLSYDSGFVKNIIMLGVDICPSVQIDKKKKNLLVLGKRPEDVLDDTSLTPEK